MKPRIVFMGTPEFAVPALKRLLADGYFIVGVVTQPDRPKGRHMDLAPPPVKQVALEHQLKVLQPDRVRASEFEKALRDLRPDLIVTAAYGRILPPQILSIPPFGCLNVHASLLPAYRGAAPVQWCLIRGEEETGVTLILMDEGMDTGPILAQKRMAIPPDINAGELSDRLAVLGADLLSEVVPRWLNGEIKPRPQDPQEGFAVPMIKPEDGKIDWNQSALAIHNRVRGLNPRPGAYTELNGKRLKIYRTRLCSKKEILEAASGLMPGTLCAISDDAIHVVCGDGVIDLLDIQPESGRRMLCLECAHNYKPGSTLGGMKS